MGDHNELVAAVHVHRKKLCTEPMPEPHKILRILQKLDRLPITVSVLQETGIGKAVNKLRKYGGEITDAVKGLVYSWKELVREAMRAEEEMNHEPDSSPVHSETRDEIGEDSEPEEEEYHEEERDGSRRRDTSEPNEDEGTSSPSGDESPQSDSPPLSPIGELSCHKPSKQMHLPESTSSRQYSHSEKERASSNRQCESSKQPLESRKKCIHDSHKGPSPGQRPRMVPDPAPSQPKRRKVSPEEISFPRDLFHSPHKIRNLVCSSPSKSPSLSKRKAIETEECVSGFLDGDKKHAQTFPQSHGTTGSSGKSPPKKVMSKPEDDRTSTKLLQKTVANGSVKPISKHGNVTEKIEESRSVPKSNSSAKVPTKTSSSSGDKETSSGAVVHKSPTVSNERKLISARTKERPGPGECQKSIIKSHSSGQEVSSSTPASKSSAIDGDVKECDSANSEIEKKRKRLSNMSSGGDEQNFNNTGMSFADILMGPRSVPTLKKPIKRLNAGSSASGKKVSSLSNSTLSKLSSLPSKSSSKSSKPGTSSSKSSTGTAKHAGGSKAKVPSASGKSNGTVHTVKERKERSKNPNTENATPSVPLGHAAANKHSSANPEIMFNLPEISADYKPLRLPEVSTKKKVGGPSAEGSYIGSKHARTKVFSGKARAAWTSVPSLFDICMRILLDNIDALYEIGVPFDIIKPILEKCTPQQLMKLEDYNPYLLEDTDPLWQIHADRDFRKYQPGELETWRELYLRKMDEREERLKNITANISASMAKKDPGRLTKMAFVNGPAKPPRSVMRQQARHGTGRINDDPARSVHKPYTPSKHVGDQASSFISSSGSAGVGVSSGGGSIAYTTGSSTTSNNRMSSPKVKSIAPMMQKALKMKKMFRR